MGRSSGEGAKTPLPTRYARDGKDGRGGVRGGEAPPPKINHIYIYIYTLYTYIYIYIISHVVLILFEGELYQQEGY